MRSYVTLALVLIACSALPVSGGEDGPAVPAGARVRLEPDRTVWRLGENVIVRYVVENASDEPFVVDTGGDGRAIRPIRNLVEVYDASGALLEDPWPDPPCFGGPGGPVDVTMSTPFVNEVPVPRYRVFERPGTYRIRVLNDLGWGGKGASGPHDWDMLERPGPEDPRWAETTIELFEPPPERIGAILDVMKEMPHRGNQSWPERNRAWSDFETIRHPAYLPALVARARERGQFEPEWLTGIRSIEAAAATRALVDLLLEAPSVQRAEALMERVPAVEWVPGLIDYVSPVGPDPLVRKRMERDAWRPEFAEPVRTWARENLGGRYSEWAKHAAYLFAAVGKAEDVAAYVEGLAATLSYFEAEETWHADAAERARLLSLYQAGTHLLRRGAEPPAEPKTSAEIALALLALRERGAEALPLHEGRLADWLTHEEAAIRDLTLHCLPRPFPEVAIEHFAALMDTEHVQLRVSVLQAIAQVEDVRFRPLVEQELRRADDTWWLMQADAAAQAVGMDAVDRARIHVASFGTEEAFRMRMQFLMSIFDNRGWGSSGTPDAAERVKLKAAWTQFLDTHADAIREGKRFAPDDPVVAPLIPSTDVVHPPPR